MKGVSTLTSQSNVGCCQPFSGHNFVYQKSLVIVKPSSEERQTDRQTERGGEREIAYNKNRRVGATCARLGHLATRSSCGHAVMSVILKCFSMMGNGPDAEVSLLVSRLNIHSLLSTLRIRPAKTETYWTSWTHCKKLNILSCCFVLFCTGYSLIFGNDKTSVYNYNSGFSNPKPST